MYRNMLLQLQTCSSALQGLLTPPPTPLHLTVSHVLTFLPEGMSSSCTILLARDRELCLRCVHSSVLILRTRGHCVPSAVKSASLQTPAQVMFFLFSSFQFSFLLVSMSSASMHWGSCKLPHSHALLEPVRALATTQGLTERAGATARWAFWHKAPVMGDRKHCTLHVFLDEAWKQTPSGLLAHPPAAAFICSDFAAVFIPTALPLQTWIRRPLTCLLHAGPSLTGSHWTIYQQKAFGKIYGAVAANCGLWKVKNVLSEVIKYRTGPNFSPGWESFCLTML